MIQLVYLSSTRWLLAAADIASILEASLRNNARDNITGILLYRSGSVLQMLEGDAELVHRLYEVIKRDTRHHRITLLYDIPIAERDFAGWSMAYHDLEEPLSPGRVGSGRSADMNASSFRAITATSCGTRSPRCARKLVAVR